VTSLDDALIKAENITKNKDKSCDPEMSFTEKNNQWYFGVKVHIGFNQGVRHWFIVLWQQQC